MYIYLIGCETNRYWSIERVEAFIGYTKSLAGDGRFVGTHEQNVRFINGKWVLYRRVPNNAQFHCYETTNNPHDGNNVPVATMVQEVTFLCSQANRIPIWVGEHNTDILGTKSVAQARAMCNINGVLGMNGPM